MSSYVRKRIDREIELNLLQQIATGEIQYRLLLIKADSGMGKSELLREFYVNRPDIAIYAVVDFKNGGINQTNFIHKICKSLGWQNFPKLESILNSSKPSSINFSDNTLIGQNRIEILLENLDKQDQEAYLTKITKAFFDDISALSRVVFIIDTYEKADINVQEWLTNIFLHYALSLPNLVFIVSGQLVPEPTIDWTDIHHIVELGGIEAVHWYNYAQSVGISVNLKWIEGCCYAIQGHPLQMAQILSSFPRKAGM